MDLKAFKPFEAPQRSVKIKFKLIFYSCPGSGREGLIMIDNMADDIVAYFLSLEKLDQFVSPFFTLLTSN